MVEEVMPIFVDFSKFPWDQLLKQSMDTAELSFIKSKNSYETAKFSVQKARTNLGYATITSPIDGVVLNKAIEEGHTRTAGFCLRNKS